MDEEQAEHTLPAQVGYNMFFSGTLEQTERSGEVVTAEREEKREERTGEKEKEKQREEGQTKEAWKQLTHWWFPQKVTLLT